MAGKRKMRDGAQRDSGFRTYGIVLFVGFLLAAGSVMIGRADEGFINVSEAMRNSNKALADEQQDGSVAGDAANTQSVQDTRARVPNGGLVGAGKSPKPAPEPEPAADANGTSTEEGESTQQDPEHEENEAAEDAAERDPDAVE